MSAKHTPGPWKKHPLKSGTHCVDSLGRCIADAPRPHGMPAEEGEANAVLISLAPDMLGVLEDFVNAGLAEKGLKGDLWKAWMKARLVVNKAKGQL